MSRHRPRIVVSLVAVATATLTMIGSGGTGASAVPPRLSAGGVTSAEAGVTGRQLLSERAAATAGAASSVTVTLVTGDRVRVTTAPDGRQTASVLTRPGDAPRTVMIQRLDGHLHVVPTDAVALITAGRLDPRLFDVTVLADEVDRSGSADLHLMVASTGSPAAPGGMSASSTRAVPAPPKAPRHSRAVHHLDSVGVTAVTVDAVEAPEFWQVQSRGRARPRTLADGVGALWLDAPVKALLDRSVPQIHADQLWSRTPSLTGAGVTVAVLDTGIDDQHVDVKDQVVLQRNFSDSDDVDDHFGHGTHVASIVAGTGAMSAGRLPAPFVGVAPDARLLDGKVLDDDGWGEESWIIAGMEWAADQGADVVSMSLGDGPTDGTDPLSQAVDRLTAEKDVLFVVAAGNDGDWSDETVGAPGTAASALTVGAVRRNNRLASFSSRGPVAGTAVVKPEVTAPGVGIVAAMAEGSLLADEVGPTEPGYLALSGTSMATPHVSGLAALLRQQFPDETAAQIKARIVSSAVPATQPAASPPTVFDQGAGRVDAVRALQSLVPVQSTLDLGFHDWPHLASEPVVEQTLTYANTSAQDATLTLGVTAGDEYGAPAPAPAFRLSATSLVVPAGGEASVTLRGAPARLGVGKWSGVVTATPAGSAVVAARTPFGLVMEPERYPVKIRPLDAAGAPAAGAWITAISREGDVVSASCAPCADPVTLRLAPGPWMIETAVFDADRFSLLPRKVTVTAARTITADAREAHRVRVVVPDAEAEQQILSAGYEVPTFGFGSSVSMFGPGRLFVSPLVMRGLIYSSGATFRRPTVVGSTTAAVAEGTYSFGVGWDVDARWEGKHSGALVTVPPGTSGDALAALVGGKYAVVRVDADSGVDALLEDLRDAGASAAVLTPADGDGAWPGVRPALPTLVADQADGPALEQAGAAGATLTVRGRQSAEPLIDVYRQKTGEIPAIPGKVYTAAALHRRTERVRAPGGPAVVNTVRYPLVGGSGFVMVIPGIAPFSRPDLLSTGTPWSEEVMLGPLTGDDGAWLNPLAGWTDEVDGLRPGGTSRETWLGGPLMVGGDYWVGARSGNRIYFDFPTWSDSSHLGWADLTGGWTATAGGIRIGAGAGAYGAVKVPSASSRITVTYKGRISGHSEVRRSRRVSAVWRFRSARVPADDFEPVPMLMVAPRMSLGPDNAVKAGSTTSFIVTARALEAGVRANRLVVETSAGGSAWKAAKVTKVRAGVFRVTLRHPTVVGPVSLRFTASATGGASVRAVVTRAYDTVG